MRFTLPLLWVIAYALWQVPTVRAQEPPLVLAFYYAWYDEKTWTPDKVSDMPVEPYRSADTATIERHVGEAHSAGIDAFVQSWLGPGTNQTEGNLIALLHAAQGRGFQAAVDVEVTSPVMPTVDDLVAGLRHVIDVHAQHPAYLRYAGKPVIFFWRQQHLTVEQWVAIRNQVDPTHSTIWIAESDHPMWLDAFDGLHLYSITWAVNTDPAYTAAKMRKRVDEYVAQHGVERYWTATTMPGYDDTRVAGRPDPYVYPRSPAYYCSTWEAAIASAPEMVIINSYNEWREGTMIEPSVTYGTTYLDLTRGLAARYKGVAAAPAATVTATATDTPISTAAPMATQTPLPTPTWTATSTPTAQPTATPTPTGTSTAVPTPTVVPLLSATLTATRMRTPTHTPMPTFAATRTYRLPETHTPTAVTATATTGSSGAGGPPCLGAGLLSASLVALVLWSRRALGQ